MAISSIAFSNTSAIDAYTAQSRGSDSRQTSTSTQQPQQESSVTKLSTTGVVKSSLEELQARAQALKSASRSSDLQEFKAAAQGVVSSINGFRQSIAATGADQNASQTLANVESAVTGKNNEALPALQNSGLNRQSNGTLTIDQSQLDNALQDNRQQTLNTYSQLASRVEAASVQPQTNGVSDVKSNDTSQNQTAPQNDRTSDAARLNAQKLAQQLASQQALASGYTALNAVTSYVTVNSL